jgi:hypothetical protein
MGLPWPSCPIWAQGCLRDWGAMRQRRLRKVRQLATALEDEAETWATSGKPKDIIWELRTNSWVGGREVSSRDFQRIAKNEWLDILEGSAPSETKEETTNNSLRGINIETLTRFGTFGHTNRSKMMVIHLDRLAPYQGAAWDERP